MGMAKLPKCRRLADAYTFPGFRPLARVQGLEIEPWAGGGRSVYVRVASSELTGRRIRVRS